MSSVGMRTIEGARLIFKNFEGREKEFNRKGDRNFCLVLDDAMAQQMVEDGLNVKQLASRDENEEPLTFVQVKVNMDPSKHTPPEITLVTSNNRTRLKGDSVALLDTAYIDNVDLIVNLNKYEDNRTGKVYVTPYLHKMFVTLHEDELDKKYGVIADMGFDEEDDEIPFN